MGNVRRLLGKCENIYQGFVQQLLSKQKETSILFSKGDFFYISLYIFIFYLGDLKKILFGAMIIINSEDFPKKLDIKLHSLI